MPGNLSPTVLHAFYDLRVSGADFDFFGFLIPAEWKRRQLGADHLHIVFVFADSEKFLPGLQDHKHQRYWRFQNILLASCSLLPACRSITTCASIKEAQSVFDDVEGPIFPEGYTVIDPVERWEPIWNYLLSNHGHDTKYLQASDQARDYVGKWADITCPEQKIVTISLRNSNRQIQRNMDLEIWSPFAHRIKEEGYFPVILPDTEMALLDVPPEFHEFSAFPSAAMNLELRAALYEASYLCLFVSNGPAVIGSFDHNIQFIQFMAHEFIDNPESLEIFHGLLFGHNDPSLNIFQKIVWEKQTIDVLHENFVKMVSLIDEKLDDGTFGKLLSPDPSNREPIIELGRRLLKYRKWPQLLEYSELSLSIDPENAEYNYWKGKALRNIYPNEKLSDSSEASRALSLASEALCFSDDLDDNLFIFGMWVDLDFLNGNFEKGKKFFRDCTENKIVNITDAFGILVGHHVDAGRHDGLELMAVEVVKNGADPVKVNRKLGAVYFEADLQADAESKLKYVFESGSSTVDDIELLGICLEELNKPAEAAEVYQYAIDNKLSNPLILFRIAMIMKNLGNFEKSAVFLIFLVGQYSHSWTLKQALSEVYFALGKSNEAKTLHIEAKEILIARASSEGAKKFKKIQSFPDDY